MLDCANPREGDAEKQDLSVNLKSSMTASRCPSLACSAISFCLPDSKRWHLAPDGWVDHWLDDEELLPGQDWNLEIEKAVDTASAVVVCISSKSVSKEGHIQRELRDALDIALEKPEGTIFIISLRLEECTVSP